MRAPLLALLLGIALCTVSGCASLDRRALLADLLFGALGDFYSGGGESRFEKKLHYDAQIQASRAAAPHFARPRRRFRGTSSR